MKKIFLPSMILLIIGTGIFFSCNKEYSCEGCKENNKPPIAVAGPDQVITLPADSILLDGRNSSDPDGTISEWLWTKISGPASFNIIRQSDSITKVKALVVGAYQFELIITDNGGLVAKDTVQVIVNDPSQPNRPPIANAGADQTITLPTNTITLNGNGSTDPDNNITSYAWIIISGPLSYSITNGNAVQTQVTNLVEGVYLFELKVTDAGGLFSKDTIRVMVSLALPQPCDNSNRPIINAQLIPVGTLSQARIVVSVATAGNKIVFAGGLKENGGWRVPASRVDIYDFVANTWSTAELCEGRYMISAIANGNKIFFGGGEVGDGTWPVDSVDIYDVSANSWSVAHLSAEGHSIAAATVGNKVLFAGGDGGFANVISGIDRAKQVDIYNLATDTWSTAVLSERKRVGHTAVAVNNKIYFAGGEIWMPDPNNPSYNYWLASANIVIYDNNTGAWSSSTMQEGKLFHSAIEIAGKMYLAGGVTGNHYSSYNSCSVEIRDAASGNNNIENLSKGASWYTSESQNAVTKNNKIIFYRPNGTTDRDKFDIYDIATNSWSIGVLPQLIPQGASIISVNNTIYIAGGSVNGVLSNQVWKLEF